ncbi:MAG: hypothetical protein ACRDAG_09710 [Cetobacterium somerae]|uniref:Replication initiator protein A n=2 Tax=Cetobacterium TaxID=180162 RepID=U7V8E8_9FUSO|nr:hypothetical protein [Cetobacterium somerae]ERT67810.1 hypothetical protein HMPREF0202_02274 [Cetobacterium somerae ATCC BAA-474]
MSKWYEEEVIDTPETEIVEENIYVDEDFIKNKSLVRVDMNVIQYPLFSKNTRRKVNQIVKYYFNKNRDTYINVTPKAGDYIPGELEEKVFIALMKVMKNKGMPRRFIVTAAELKKELKLTTKDYVKRIKESLSRLATSNYNFKNTMYSSVNKSILTQDIETTILSLKTIRLDDRKNKTLKDQISDNRIKEVYEISVSDHFYNNIMTKGYMVYNSDILLDIDTSTARTIYMLIEKLRYHELYLRIDTLFLIKRIPLKFNPKNPHNTIKILENNLNELKIKNLIKEFNFVKDSTWEKSEIEIHFYEDSAEEKQERFFDDFNDFKNISTQLTISATEHDTLTENEKEQLEKTVITKELIEELFNKLPNIAKKLKSMPKTIADSIEKYGEEKVRGTIAYLNKQKKLTSPRAFFLKALENDWAGDIIIEKTKKENLSQEKIEIRKDEVIDEKFLQLEASFELLTQEEKDEIEKNAFKNYIKICGMNTKIQKMAFNAGKKRIILNYLNEIDYFNCNSSPELEVIEIEAKNKSYSEPLTKEFLSLAKDYINNVLIMLEGDFSKEELLRLKMRLTKEVLAGNIQTIDDVQNKVEEILLGK